MEENGTAELNYLNYYYESKDSQIVVLYGQKNMGMADMLKEFGRDKSVSRYYARPCSEREQIYLWSNELKEEGAVLSDYPSYSSLLNCMIEKRAKKKVLIIEEFQNIVRLSESFMQELIAFVRNQWNNQPVIVILCSTSIGWIENSMVRKLGEAAFEISGFVKMKEQDFFDMAEYFQGLSRKQQVEIYAVLGGFPELWEHFDAKASIRENVCRNVLPRSSFLYEEALRLVAGELREPNVYHAILCALASGRQKLNDLHLHTGFSRAKISVYLKNLMELEIVEKVFSYETDGRDNVQKGIYRIRNHFVHFYFRYLYPHMSRLTQTPFEEYYDTYIEPDFAEYVSSYYGQICREYMERMNQRQKLPFVYERAGEWVGKMGNIDLIAQDEEGHTLAALSSWDKPVMPYEDYEWLGFCLEKAKLHADYIYLFSSSKFDEKLSLEAEEKDNLQLMSLSML